MSEATFVIVGGGIAGVTCVEQLSYLCPHEKVILLTSSPLIKNITNIVHLSKIAYKFDVTEVDVETLKKNHPSLTIVYDSMVSIVSTENKIITEKGETIRYKYLCVCTGAIPKVIPQALNNDRVLGIRDTGSVKNYLERLKRSKKIVVVGNGGIASELIYATKGVDTTWIIKDKHFSSTFVDPGAAEFFRSSENFEKKPEKQPTVFKRMIYSEEDVQNSSTINNAAALGPDWLKGINAVGSNATSSLNIIYETDIKTIDNSDNGELIVQLTNGQTIQCDIVVSATGVIPNIKFDCDQKIELGADGGIAVDWQMKTSVKNVYAAGDVCCAKWDPAPQWLQMRLWSQAYQMGGMAAKSMKADHVNEEILQDFCFELFSHTTKLFGYQVVLLGNFNGQGLGRNYEILIRTTPNLEYIKFVIADNRLQGVILIGETGLEETCENLILNQIDLSPYGDDILNPDIDIEDYFD